MPSTTESGHIAAPRPYPPSIARAADRATDDRLASIRALSVNARLALQKITRCISTSDITQSVRIGRDLLARILGVSTKTISRIKTELEKAGWIERHQVMSRKYGMQVGDIWLTPWALQELQLVVPGKFDPINMPIASEDNIAIRAAVPPKQANFLSKNVPRSVGQKCPTPYLLSQSLSERQSAAAVALPVVFQEKNPEDTTTCAPAHDSSVPDALATTATDSSTPDAPAVASDDSVPDDLMVLRACGIPVSGIRKLMGMATQAGHFLGNIVEVAGDNILGARNPFSYVCKLISSKTDWQGKLAYLREQQFQQELMDKQALCSNQNLDTIQQAMAATGMIASHKRTHVWKLDDEGIVRKAEIAQLLADPMLTKWLPLLDMAGLAQAIGEGKLFAVDMQDLRDMQGDGQHHEGEGSQQGEQAAPQAVCEPLQELPMPTPVTVAEPPPAAAPAEPAVPVAQPALSTPPSTAQVKPVAKQQPQQPWHNLPQRRELDAIWAAAAQSPDALLSNHKQAKVWKIIDGWLKVATVQELLNTKTAIIHWQPLSPEGVVDFAKRLQQGQLFPVDKQTLQSWCPQPQPASVQSAMQARPAAAKVPDRPSPQTTGTQNWRTSLASLFNKAQGQFQGAGA